MHPRHIERRKEYDYGNIELLYTNNSPDEFPRFIAIDQTCPVNHPAVLVLWSFQKRWLQRALLNGIAANKI
jgi:hypothetical protein